MTGSLFEQSDEQFAQLRMPPHGNEAEQSVLGALLLDNLAFEKVADLLGDGDFYTYAHRLIFTAICQLINQTKPADVLTTYEQLVAQGQAEEVGGLDYLGRLSQCVPSAANVRRYAQIVRDKSILRRLITSCDEITTQAFAPQGQSVAQLLDSAEQKIFQIAEDTARATQGFFTIGQLAKDIQERANEMANSPHDIIGVPTGFYDLDRMTSGLQGGDLVILAARPSMGKTALAINIAEHVAVREGMPVLVFSMEMSASQLAVRVVGSLGRIDQTRLRTGKLNDDEWPRLTHAIEQLSQTPLVVDESPSLNPSEIRARARRLARQYGGRLGLVVVDYLQLMSGSARGSDENRATELGEISRGLKILAKELQCPVIALSQLNRSVETRQDKRPMMSDLRESGAIEQDADVIMFIYRDEYYDKESNKKGIAELIIGKQRNGPTGTIELTFLNHLTRFENLAASSGGDDRPF
jgi:replicative DNA helicase